MTYLLTEAYYRKNGRVASYDFWIFDCAKSAAQKQNELHSLYDEHSMTDDVCFNLIKLDNFRDKWPFASDFISFSGDIVDDPIYENTPKKVMREKYIARGDFYSAARFKMYSTLKTIISFQDADGAESIAYMLREYNFGKKINRYLGKLRA